jgi:hypothetical protein
VVVVVGHDVYGRSAAGIRARMIRIFFARPGAPG